MEFINRVNEFIVELGDVVKSCDGDYESIRIAFPKCEKDLKLIILDGKVSTVACECDFGMFLD